MAVGAGFMQFAHGWNETVHGWYDEAAGTVQEAWNYGANGDDQSQEGLLDGAAQNAEGHEEVEQGENRMGGGLSEMFGLVDHGDGT